MKYSFFDGKANLFEQKKERRPRGRLFATLYLSCPKLLVGKGVYQTHFLGPKVRRVPPEMTTSGRKASFRERRARRSPCVTKKNLCFPLSIAGFALNLHAQRLFSEKSLLLSLRGGRFRSGKATAAPKACRSHRKQIKENHTSPPKKCKTKDL